ncbi:MAG: hypothetical protein R2799_00575 [Crocinitomicaceae bacterium]
MDLDQLKIKSIAFIRKRFYPLVFLTIAVILWFIQYLVQIRYGDKIPASVTWMRLISYFLLFLSPYVFLLKEKRYLFANLIVIGPIFILIEATCFYLLDSPEKIKKEFALPSYPEGHPALDLGNVADPDTVIYEKKMQGDVVCFDVSYSFDSLRRRKTPKFDSTRSKYALFFGCSIAFGYGLNDNETLPFHFQEKSQMNAYNYAYNGWGTNQMLAWLQRENLSKQVKEKDGAAFYIFFWDHIPRALGTMDRYTQWVAYAPYFYMDGNQIKRDRTFKDGRYWTSKFYELFYQTSIAEYFKINFPNKLREDHYNLISEMILESKKTYEKQFGNSNFYVVIYPTFKDYEEEQMKLFIEFLKEKGINIIDLSNFIEYGAQYHLIGDSHPRGSTNEMIAEEILKQMN